ncbi:MAG: transcriptional regulator [Burkholderiaceae bacterium]|nr:transcriptional regulator [Burkholderiaceae bacterium]MCD8537094.1 transcriptional regulator [Burkholderiaceae bacterium]
MEKQYTGLTDALFTKTKQRVLGILFGQPQRSFYAGEIIKLAGIGSGSVQRELALLTESGLVTVKRIGHQKHYQANQESPLFVELSSIIQKTVGLAEPIQRALSHVATRIDAAFVYGSIAKKADTASSDIDLMIISNDIDYPTLFAVLEKASAQLGRSVNPTILSKLEIKQRLEKQDAFMTKVLAQPKVWIIGETIDIGI